jgi:Ran GTPase-activating protein (RanGAP) involved in mRNA processing and transport
MKQKYGESWLRLQTALNPSLSRSQSNKSTRRSLIISSAPSSRRISIAGQIEHPVIPISQLKQLFKSKCEDMDIPEVPDQESRFLQTSISNFRNRSFLLTDSNLGQRSSISIGHILKSNEFAYINLSRNRLSDEGSSLLFKDLKINSSIVHVDISNNEISSEGSCQIFQILISHPSIISLDISSYEGLKRNRIGESAASILQRVLIENKILQFLALAGTGLGEFLQIFTDGLCFNTGLVSLDLSNNGIHGKNLEFLAKAVGNTNIQKLNLSSNRISDKGCKFLSRLLNNGFQKCCPLTFLDISNNLINGKGSKRIFESLRFNNILEELVFHSNNLAFNFQVYFSNFLGENCGLVKLNISNNQLNSKCWSSVTEGLIKNRRLEVLNISNNPIEDEGLKNIAAGLAKNKKIQTIDLSACQLKDSAAVTLIKGLRSNFFIEVVHLKNNNLKESAAEALLELARSNKHLQIISLDSNPVNFKYISGLKAQLRENRKLRQSQIIPRILSEIEKIKIPIEKYQENNQNIKNKLELKIKSEKRLWNKNENIDEIHEKEKKITQEMKEKVLKCKNENLAKSVLIEELKSEEIVRIIKKMKNYFEKNVNDLLGMIRKGDSDFDRILDLRME